MTMRRIVLLSSILLLSAAWAVGQYSSGSDDKRADASKVTIEGCIAGAAGNYTLTDQLGGSYQLTGNTEKVKSHVGEVLRVTGILTPVVHLPGGVSQGTESKPSVAVI